MDTEVLKVIHEIQEMTIEVLCVKTCLMMNCMIDKTDLSVLAVPLKHVLTTRLNAAWGTGDILFQLVEVFLLRLRYYLGHDIILVPFSQSYK